MPLLGNKSAKHPAPPKDRAPDGFPRFTVGSLFNPHIGTTLRPLGESGKMLVMLIASLFAANGLFPRNHPALLGIPGNKLKLREVLSIGWSHVRFTRATLPQTLMFFAVVISLGCSVLAIIAILMSLFVGKAHAQSFPTGASMFQPPPEATNDIAIGWINWLFYSQPMATDYLGPQGQVMPMGASDSMGLSTIIQTALVKTLGFYSEAILVIAAVVLFYHLTSMIVETAHHGVAMGRRANQVWAPIRLVVAIGLLVPISGGLNSGQHIVLQVAAWGSGLASQAWYYFMTELQRDTAGYVPPRAPYDRSTVSDTYTAAACQMAYNTIINSGLTPERTQILDAGSEVDNVDGSKKFSYTPVGDGADPTMLDLCGFYVRPADVGTSGFTTSSSETTIANNVQGAVTGAFSTMQSNAITWGENDVKCFIPPMYMAGGSGNGDCPNGLGDNPPAETHLEPMISEYETALQDALTNAASGLGSTMTDAITLSTQSGWVSAGSWFNTVARLQGDLTALPHDMLPKTAPPQVFKLVQEDKLTPGTVAYQVGQIMVEFQQWVNRGYNTPITGVTPPAMTGGTYQQTQLLTAQAGIMQNGGEGKPHFMDYIFQGIDFIASMDGVWNANPDGCRSASCFTLGVQFTTYNPLAEIAHFGHSNLNAAYDIFDEYILLSAAASGLQDAASALGIVSNFRAVSIFARALQFTSSTAGQAAAAIGSILGMVVVVFFTAGFMLAYFLPLIPFYRFLFGILSWFVSLLEAVVAVPLIALAHLTPEGDGFMGEKAKTAYYFVFAIFLRPILMVFGLIAGFLIFALAASAMNLFYATAVAGAGGISNGHFTLARLVFSIIYVVILYLCCNNCFRLIDWLPEHALKWMGGASLHHAQIADPAEVGSHMGIATAYIDQQLVQGAGKLMSSPAGAVALGGLLGSNTQAGADARNIAAQVGRTIEKQTGAPINDKMSNLVTTLKDKYSSAEKKFHEKGKGTGTEPAAVTPPGTPPGEP